MPITNIVVITCVPINKKRVDLFIKYISEPEPSVSLTLLLESYF